MAASVTSAREGMPVGARFSSLPERDPLRNNTLFGEFRKCLDGFMLPSSSPSRWFWGRKVTNSIWAVMKVAEFESLSVVRTLNRLRTLPNRAGYLADYHQARP